MKLLVRLLAAVIAAGCCSGARADEAHPALVSFAELYRATVAAAALPPQPAESVPVPQVRVAAVQQAGAPQALFAIATPASGPDKWMLVLAGLAAAGWVARRRLSAPY